MKKALLLVIVVSVIWAGCGTAWAFDEPLRSVEVFRKPGFDFRSMKTFGAGMAIQLMPVTSWAVEKADPYLKERIRNMVKTSLKASGYTQAVDETAADFTVKVKVFEWGRFRNTDNQNLMEYIDLDIRVFAGETGEMALRGTARYRLRNPKDPSMSSLHAEAVSMIDEIFGMMASR